MTTAHANYLESIRTATKEKPFAVSSDFFDKVQNEDPTIFKLLQLEIKARTAIIIPSGYQLAEV